MVPASPRRPLHRRALVPWLAPVLALALGAATLVSAEVELREVRALAQRRFESEVAAITRLVADGARQAARSVDLVYDHAELDLAAAAPSSGARDGAHLGAAVVSVTGADVADLDGDWGPVPVAARRELARRVLAAPLGEIVEDGVLRAHGLYCAHFAAGERRRVRCKRAAGLSHLRREVGLGRLLRDVRQGDVVHVALQDEGGVIAASQGAALSGFGADPFLVAAARSSVGLTTFRRIEHDGRRLVEGATPFTLPDGSRALLRVGVDAAGLRTVEARLDSRRRAHLLLVTLLVLAAVAVAFVLASRQRQAQRHEDVERARGEDQRHWQTVGQMAATVAHEVRAPLSTITMAAQRLRREFEVPAADREEYRELTALVAAEADRLERVVRDFLALGRPLELRREPVRADEALAAAVAPLRLAAAQGQRRLEVEGAPVEVSLDRQRFVQLVGNLVSNALDAVPAGGLVRVSARAVAGALEVTVEDDGPGMDGATLARVQEPFVSTKGHGTGLGLPLARRLAEAHGGRLELTSTVGHGTIARVRLPLPAPGGDR